VTGDARLERRRRTSGALLLSALTAMALATAGGCRPRVEEPKHAPSPTRSATPGAPRPLASPPNLVIVLIDTLRADHTSVYGAERDTTPFLARLASQGVVYEQARAQSSCTFSSVGSILTGRSPRLFLGQPGGRLGFVAGVPTLQELLRARGYRTLAVSASTVVRKSQGKHNRHGGFDVGFDEFAEDCQSQRAGCVTAAALAAATAVAPAAPFFLYAHYVDPHSPYVPAPRFRRRFAEGGGELRKWVREGELAPVRDFVRKGGPRVEMTPAELRHIRALYDEDILTVDDGVRELVDGLEALPGGRETIYVVLADHGEEFLEHGGVYHCSTTYEEQLRTPLVLVGPGVVPGRDARVAQNLDVMPTLLDLLGVDRSHLPLEGRNLLEPLAAGEAAPLAFASQDLWRSVTDGRFKIVLEVKTRAARLYDLQADPGETRDVAEANRPEFRRLWKALVAHLDATEGGISNTRSMKAMDESLKQLRALGYL
jgi:choline-sulfatase